MADVINVNTKHDAYKGDGMKGVGDFFAGIAQAYSELSKHTDFVESHLTPQQKAQVQSWVDAASARFQSAEFSKSTAFSDADLLMTQLFTEHRESDLPKIYNRDCQAGLYNSTSSQLMANDAYARKVAETARLKIDTAKAYADIETGRAQPLASAVAAATADSTNRTEDYHEETTPKTEAFATDFAVFIAAMQLMDLVQRKYFADTET